MMESAVGGVAETGHLCVDNTAKLMMMMHLQKLAESGEKQPPVKLAV